MIRFRHLILVLAPASAVVALWSCGTDSTGGGGGGSNDAAIDTGVTRDGAADTAPAIDGAIDDAGSADASAPYACLPLGSIDGGAFAPSNFAVSAIDASATADIDVTDVDGGCAFDTTALTLSCANQTFVYSATAVDQANGPQIAVFATGSFTIEPGVIVDAHGTRPLVVYANGAIDIGGELRASQASAPPTDPPSGAPNAFNPAGNDFGTGASFCGAGGATAFDGGDRSTYGTAALIPLVAGMSPGGPYDNHETYGGGAIQLSSNMSIRVRAGGLIDVNGTGGAFRYSQTNGTWVLGGGSGGAISLEAPSVDVAGDLAANGGGGGTLQMNQSGSGATSANTGGAAGCDYPNDGGGAGSFGDDPNGQAATLAPVNATSGCQSGGGAGFIAVKARACSISGTLSPSMKSGCANVMPPGP